MSGSARASTQGGDPAVLQVGDNIRAWLGKSVPTHQWEQVWITKAAPLTAILNNQLQSELTNLHQSLTTYCPTTTATITADGTSFDGAPHAFKMLSKIAIFSGGHYIKSLAVKYATEPSLVKYGTDQMANNEFELTPREHVTDIIIWKDHKGVCGIQMNTNKGRTSNHFGSDNGSPTILRSPGGCLAGFSGVVQDDKVHDLQTIWRHDVQGPGLGGDRVFSQYYGGVAGKPFSDWPSVRQSDSTYIKNIRVKCGTYIDGIQITYEDSSRGGGSTFQRADYHGGSGGRECFFHLESNEYIVAVLGRYNKYIVQLCFVTNKGRTSDIFGGGDGEDFRCQAPATNDGKATRLHYIAAKAGIG
ncbi:Jacalin-like lectin domain-containing protein [Rhizoctonia solani]|nr:Jacalin-like lectin domain-containing protein [Rhizoctonia solani]